MWKFQYVVGAIVFNQLWCMVLSEQMNYNEVSSPSAEGSLMPLPYEHHSSGIALPGRAEYGYERNTGRGWMDTAKNALSGPAGQIMVQFAKEMISRSAGNSQILSLNLSNLLILLLLKALIFSAGLIGAGNWNQYARGRAVDNSILSAEEPPLLIGYLAAEGSGDDSCLHRAACQSPGRANEYLKAAKALLKGAEMFDANLDYNAHYYGVIQKAERAVLDGMTGSPCEAIYHCRL